MATFPDLSLDSACSAASGDPYRLKHCLFKCLQIDNISSKKLQRAGKREKNQASPGHLDTSPKAARYMYDTGPFFSELENGDTSY